MADNDTTQPQTSTPSPGSPGNTGVAGGSPLPGVAKAPQRAPQKPSKGRMVMFNPPEHLPDCNEQLAGAIVRVHDDEGMIDLYVYPDGIHNVGVVRNVPLGTSPGSWQWPSFVG